MLSRLRHGCSLSCQRAHKFSGQRKLGNRGVVPNANASTGRSPMYSSSLMNLSERFILKATLKSEQQDFVYRVELKSVTHQTRFPSPRIREWRDCTSVSPVGPLGTMVGGRGKDGHR